MLTLALPPELERALNEQARVQNIEPKLLAINILQERFASPASITDDSAETPHDSTMAEYWAGFIGVIDSSKTFPNGSNLSEDTGKKFAEDIVKKHGSDYR